MEDIRQKLQEGHDRLDKESEQPGLDKDLLGLALISFHGALESYFRDSLAALPGLPDVRSHQVQWKTLADLAEEHLGLTRQEKSRILGMNDKRNAIAHGNPYTLTHEEVAAYAQFVERLIGLHSTLPPQFTPQPEPIPIKIYQPYSVPQRDERYAPPPRRRRIGCLWILVVIASTFFLASLYEPGLIGLILFDDRTITLEKVWELLLADNVGDTAIELTPVVTRGVGSEGNGADSSATEVIVPGQNSAQGSDSASPSPIGTIRIRVPGNSNVREGPNTEAPVVGVAPGGEIYDVLETTPERSWFKIRLENGQEGWIGSSRVEVVSP